uniref:Putative ovule protein n=1 Tax=Solanum chacoense TaxID=4108 RepID=A0A0V0H4P4_SOLCH
MDLNITTSFNIRIRSQIGNLGDGGAGADLRGLQGVHPNPLGKKLHCMYKVNFLYFCTYIYFEPLSNKEKLMVQWQVSQ